MVECVEDKWIVTEDRCWRVEKIFIVGLKILVLIAWVKVFRIIPEFRILRLSFHRTFHRKSASKSWIRQFIIGFPVYIQSV